MARPEKVRRVANGGCSLQERVDAMQQQLVEMQQRLFSFAHRNDDAFKSLAPNHNNVWSRCKGADTPKDLQDLAQAIKSELSSQVGCAVDKIMARFIAHA